MSGKTAAGLVLIAVGIGAAAWGINLMNSFGAQLAGSLGLHDNTGPIAIGVGILFGLIGLALVVSKGSPAKS